MTQLKEVVETLWDKKSDYKDFDTKTQFLEEDASETEDLKYVQRSQCRTTHKRKDC